MPDMDITLFRAMERSHDHWRPENSHTENNQAYEDRTLMATEITKLRQELADLKDAMAERETSAR